MLWEIAHEQGLRLPTKDYWEFNDLILLDRRLKHDEYLNKFELTQKIQSSPLAMERCIMGAISRLYRKSRVTVVEIRMNPLKRNRGGFYDVDQIILSAIIGMKRACLIYPVKAGIIIETDRAFGEEQSAILAEKAVRYASDGVVGFDISGQVPDDFKVDTHVEAFREVRESGLNITFHTGEMTGPDEMWEVLEKIHPNRIGHGVMAHKDEKLCRELAKREVLLEVCPTSNVTTGVVESYDELADILQTLDSRGVKITLCADGPEFLGKYVKDEYERMAEAGIDTDRLESWRQNGFRGSFIGR